MLEEITALLRARWEELLPEQPAPERMDYVLLSRSRVILFAFAAARSRHPLVVVKVCRTPNENSWTEKSVARVAAVRRLVDEGLARTIPKVVLLGHVRGLVCVAETVLAGKKMGIARRPRRAAVDQEICAVATWLQAFHRQTSTGLLRLDDMAVEEQVVQPVLPYLDDEGGTGTSASLRMLAGRLRDQKVPLGWRYGDANPENFLLEGHRVSGAVDWGSCRSDTWPIFDWCDFAFNYAAFSHRAMSRRKFVELSDAGAALEMLLAPPRNRVSSALQAATARFLGAQGLEPGHWPALFAAFLPTLKHSWEVAPLVRHALPLLLAWRAHLGRGSRQRSQAC